MNWTYLLYLACPIGMGAMMWMMMRNNDQAQTKAPTAGAAGDLSSLHQQLQSLESQQASIMSEIRRLREAERSKESSASEPSPLRTSSGREA